MSFEHYPTTRAADVAHAASLDSMYSQEYCHEDVRAIVAEAGDAVAETIPFVPGAAAPSVEPGACIKLVHLMRHGQGIHNVLVDSWSELQKLGGTKHVEVRALFGLDPTRELPGGPKYPPLVVAAADPPLTERGVKEAKTSGQQALAARLKPKLLAVSPMRRAAVTGMTAFPNVPRIVAHECLHECSGVYSWDKRRDLKELQKDSEFAAVDLSLLRSETCPWWPEDRRETPCEMAKRLMDFMRWLREQPEDEIAVASHGHILSVLIQCGALQIPEGAMTVHGTRATSWFITAEIRSFWVKFKSRERKRKHEAETDSALD